jgi:RND family efflux transporter MFP subunit
MAQDDPIRVFVDVPQSASADLMRVGVPATISTNEAAGQSIAGRITRTSDAIDPKARTFRAELDIPNPDRRLVPGMYVQVGFQLRNSGMSQVPAATLLFSAAGPKVAIVAGDGTVHFQPVTIGRDDGDKVELSSGVADGEQLVLNISNQIADGVKVQVSDDKPQGASVARRTP